MPEKTEIQRIFSDYKTIAVYGMSRNSWKPASYVPEFLASKGYTVIPINPYAQQLADAVCYEHLADIPLHVDILLIFRPSQEIPGIVKEAIKRKQEKHDISVIWLQSGIINEEARSIAEQEQIVFVQNRCMMQEYPYE